MRVAEAGAGGQRYFLDSNVLLYLLSADAAKADGSRVAIPSIPKTCTMAS